MMARRAQQAVHRRRLLFQRLASVPDLQANAQHRQISQPPLTVTCQSFLQMANSTSNSPKKRTCTLRSPTWMSQAFRRTCTSNPATSQAKATPSTPSSKAPATAANNNPIRPSAKKTTTTPKPTSVVKPSWQHATAAQEPSAVKSYPKRPRSLQPARRPWLPMSPRRRRSNCPAKLQDQTTQAKATATGTLCAPRTTTPHASAMSLKKKKSAVHGAQQASRVRRGLCGTCSKGIAAAIAVRFHGLGDARTMSLTWHLR
jgi:hypothetical protein